MQTKKENTTSPYKIIVVTSDKSFLKKLDEIFDENFNLIHSLPVDNIVKKTCNIQPDLILKDVSKHKVVDFQPFKSLKSDFRTHNIPIVIITEKDRPDNIDEILNAGVSDHITKQFTPAETSRIIKTHLELKRKIDENKEMHFVKSKFFSIMTNDIKDSLIGVKGIAGFLLKDLEENSEKTKEIVKMARILYEDSQELYNFLENLIEWASIETNDTEIIPEKINLQDIISNIITNFNKEISSKNLELINNYDENIELISDKKALNIVLTHLISNAIKYSNKDGKVTINAESTNNGSSTKISVEDNGVGMDNDVVNNIFRIDTPHPKTIGTNGEKGTGLGLIICRSIIEKIFGNIDIESKKHRGTKGTIKIPELKH